MSGAAPPPQELQGKLALVTGASRGIGLAVAAALKAGGARVVRLARSIRSSAGGGGGGEYTDFRCDVTDPAAVTATIGQVLAGPGVPDIVVNNAGVFLIKPLEQTTPEEFAAAVSTNLTAPFLVARALLPHLTRRNSGHLITIGSISDHRAFPGNAAYGASKHGVRGLHDVIAVELRGTRVRTTLISPGPVDTAIWDSVNPDARPGFTRRQDMLHAEDVAGAVVWAASQPARVDVTEIRINPAGYTPRD
ncbi:MAG: SDR family oxidoreductase [Gemmatimonadales bacterium]